MRILRRILSVSNLMILLFILMLISLGIFLTGPRLYNEDLISTKKYEFTLEPYGNKTVLIPSSFDQTFYLISARNLILNNTVFVEINATGPFTLYKLDGNITVKLAEHILFYSSNLYDIGNLTELSVKNEGSQNISVKMNFKRIVSVKAADFTISHVGFIIFIITLFSLQFLSFVVKKDTLIGRMVTIIFFKLIRKSLSKQKSTTSLATAIVELILPISILFLFLYAIMISFWQEIISIKNIFGYAMDYFARILFIFITIGFFFAVIVRIFELIFRNMKIWILRNKSQEALKIYEKTFHIFKSEEKKIILLAFVFLLVATIMFVLNFKYEIIIGISFIVGLILYAASLQIEMKQLKKSLTSNNANEKIADFLEIDMKTSGFFVLMIIAFFVLFTSMKPLFSLLTKNLFLLEFYPSFIYDAIHTFLTLTDDIFIFLGKLQVPACILVTGPYLITRIMLYKFRPRPILRILRDIAFFFSIFFISEYLTWSYYYFPQNQPYNLTNVPVSLLISITASIVEDLLNEIRLISD